MEERNESYVKVLDENGKSNFPKGGVIHKYPNRRQRKQSLKIDRFMSNKKGVSLTIIKKDRYERFLQWIGSKCISHYRLKTL